MQLDSLSNALADAVEAVAPSLLHVHGRAAGTAMVVAPGRAVTAAHLVGEPTVRVTDPSGAAHDARVLGVDAGLDLALIEVNPSLPPVTWGPAPRVGGLALPVGRGPGGLSATLGLFRRIGGRWQAGSGEVDAYFDVDGSLPPGFSGGPLLGAGGVVGMNTHRLVPGGATLPRATVERLTAELEARGTVTPGFLGIGGARAVLAAPQVAVAGQSSGLLVISVATGGPADGVLSVGDVVLRVDGKAVDGVNELRAALGRSGAGQAVSLEVLTGHAVEARQVVLAARPTC